MLNMVDYFGGTLLIFALAMFELAGIFWIYGKKKITQFSTIDSKLTGFLYIKEFLLILKYVD